jgi:transposase
VVILDGAGWHRSQGLLVPGNITLLALPPYSSELNPVERIWHYLRSHWLSSAAWRISWMPAGGLQALRH